MATAFVLCCLGALVSRRYAGAVGRRVQIWLASIHHEPFSRKLGQYAETLEVNSMGVETSLQCLLFPSLPEHVSELPKTISHSPRHYFWCFVRSEGREP